MAIERCDKCGKPFMTKSELERHKMWEHPVPVSPFEDGRFAAATNNEGIYPEDLHRLTSDVIGGSRRWSNRNDITTIGSGGGGGGGQRRKVPHRPFRLSDVKLPSSRCKKFKYDTCGQKFKP